jgi:hypothetical protein
LRAITDEAGWQAADARALRDSAAVGVADLRAFQTTFGSLQEIARERDIHFSPVKKALMKHGPAMLVGAAEPQHRMNELPAPRAAV